MAIRDAIIAVDFDGTVVTHAYPHIGNDIGAVPVLRELIGNGCRVILYTMRSGRLLDDAVAWFARNDIPLYAVNENPAQREWTDSPTSTSTTARWDARSSSKTASNARSSIGSRCGNVSSKRAFSTEPAGTRETRRVPVSSAPRAFVTNALGAFRKILPDADELPKRTETDFSRRYSLQTFSPQPMIFSAGCGLSPSGFAERRQTMLDDTTK